MLDTKTLISELTGIIGLYAGFAQSSDPVASYHSDGALFLSDAHKLLRPELLADLGPQLAKISPKEYSETDTYTQYELVLGPEDEGDKVYYESLSKANTSKLLTDATAWRQTTLLSAWYGRIERGAINKLMRWLAETPPPKPLIERQALYGKESNLQGIINKSGSFLALRLRLIGRNTSINLARLGLQATGPLTAMPMYIFHSESLEPIAIVELTGTTSNRTIWANPNQYLFEQWTGYYLVGYFEQDLPSGVSVVGGQRSFQIAGCGSCDPADYGLAVTRSPYLHITPVHVPDITQVGVMSWADEQTSSTQTWGINMVIEARCDVTQSLIINKEMLTSALLYTIACDVLEEISTTDRVNGTAAQMKSAAYVALYGQANSKTDFGLTSKRDKLVGQLKAVMAKMAPDCMAVEVPQETISFESMFDV